MKKIINWTFGSVFRTFGRIIAYISIGLLISLIVAKSDIKITDLLGFTKVYASEIVNTNLNRFYVRTCDGSGENCEWSNSSDMGIAISTGTTVLDGFRGRFGSSSKFLKGVKYRVKFNVAMTNATSTSDCDLWYYKVRDVYCSGSLTNSWSSDPDLIESCQFITRSCYTAGDQVRAHYYYDIVTNSDVYGFQINTYFNRQYFLQVGGVNVMTSSNVSYDRDTTDAINNSTTTIINNNTENTQEIINNQNSNTQEIINNQNSNTQQQIESQKVCSNIIIDKTNIEVDNAYLTNTGVVITSGYGIENVLITPYIEVLNATNITVLNNSDYQSGACFYDSDKTIISCFRLNEYRNGATINIPNNSYYFRSTIYKNTNMPTYQINICKNGNQANYEMNHSVYEGIHDLDNNINNSDTTESSNSFMNFLDNFTETDFGLASIITMPLTFISTITTNTCQEVVLPIPYLDNKNLTLPCMRDIYDSYFGGFMNIYDIITFGIISYKILLDIFRMLHNFRNPENNEIEVLDL